MVTSFIYLFKTPSSDSRCFLFGVIPNMRNRNTQVLEPFQTCEIEIRKFGGHPTIPKSRYEAVRIFPSDFTPEIANRKASKMIQNHLTSAFNYFIRRLLNWVMKEGGRFPLRTLKMILNKYN